MSAASTPFHSQNRRLFADEDRASNPRGGVLVFMDNETEAETMRAILAVGLGTRDYTVGLRAGNETNSLVGIAVTTKKDTAGYNFVRMGAIVTGVYAESAASRRDAPRRSQPLGPPIVAVRGPRPITRLHLRLHSTRHHFQHHAPNPIVKLLLGLDDARALIRHTHSTNHLTLDRPQDVDRAHARE